MAYTVVRCCVACRRMIPADNAEELLAFVRLNTEYSEKTGKMAGKLKQGTIEALCPNCAPKFWEIVSGQKEKGIKVL